MPAVQIKNLQQFQFPVGYSHFHKDVSLNFQMNRWVNWLGQNALTDMRSVASKIKNYADWKREMLTLAQTTASEGRLLNAAFYEKGAGTPLPWW